MYIKIIHLAVGKANNTTPPNADIKVCQNNAKAIKPFSDPTEKKSENIQYDN